MVITPSFSFTYVNYRLTYSRCCLFTLQPGLRMSDLSGSGINAQEQEPVYTARIIWPSQSLFLEKRPYSHIKWE